MILRAPVLVFLSSLCWLSGAAHNCKSRFFNLTKHVRRSVTTCFFRMRLCLFLTVSEKWLSRICISQMLKQAHCRQTSSSRAHSVLEDAVLKCLNCFAEYIADCRSQEVMFAQTGENNLPLTEGVNSCDLSYRCVGGRKSLSGN